MAYDTDIYYTITLYYHKYIYIIHYVMIYGKKRAVLFSVLFFKISALFQKEHFLTDSQIVEIFTI
jgi:hypothetical protein